MTSKRKWRKGKEKMISQLEINLHSLSEAYWYAIRHVNTNLVQLNMKVYILPIA
jgi:hypothetical protein